MAMEEVDRLNKVVAEQLAAIKGLNEQIVSLKYEVRKETDRANREVYENGALDGIIDKLIDKLAGAR